MADERKLEIVPAGWTYRDSSGRYRKCRVQSLDECADDPMNAIAPMDEIYDDARRQDIRDGCPDCIASLIGEL